MGNMCGSPDRPTITPIAAKNNNTKISSNMKSPRTVESEWRSIKLPDKLTIKCMHSCELVKFKTGQPPAPDEQYDDSEDENKWFCNGGEETEGFVGGCKSGQTTFGYHEGTEGW